MKKLFYLVGVVIFVIGAFFVSAPLVSAQVADIVSVNAISDISVANGTPLVGAGLPNTADVNLNLGPVTSLEVTWNGGSPVYNGDTAGTYLFTGVLTLPDSVTNSGNLIASVNVVVGEPAGPDYVKIFGDIKTTLLVQGITTNIDGCASAPTGCSNLYFEKTNYGRVTFSASLDLTDTDTNTFLQNLGTKMDASAGSMSFDATTATLLKNAGAEIKMYGLDVLGFTAIPNLIVKDDLGTIIPPSDIVNYPTLSRMSFDAGTLTFSTNHFTQFEVDNNVYVDDSNISGIEDGSQTNPYNTIQEGITAVPVGGTVNVYPGTYSEGSLSRDIYTGGAGANNTGLLVYKNGLTIQGVDSLGNSITDKANVVATIIATQRDASLGDTIITGDNVTLSGLKFQLADLPVGCNKNVFATGENFTLKNSVVDNLNTGCSGLYLSDERGSHVNTFTIQDNQFLKGEITIINGVGLTGGSVSTRNITGNLIQDITDWGGVSLTGITGSGWTTQGIGAVTISGNTFSNNAYQIIARGASYENPAGYWTGFLANNTFDKAVLTLTPDNDARMNSYERLGWVNDLTTSSYNDYFRMIGTNIQESITRATAGDTINVAVGTYNESQIVVNKPLTLQGAASSTTIIDGGGTSTGGLVKITASSGTVTISGFTIQNTNNSDDLGHGINVDNGGVSGIDVKILNNAIKNVGPVGIRVNDADSVQIEGNIISLLYSSTEVIPNGIQVGWPNGSGVTGTIKTNEISGCSWVDYDAVAGYDDSTTSAGILIMDATAALEISDNVIHNNDVGIDIEAGSSTRVESNDIHDNAYGVVSYNENPSINNNKIVNNSTGSVYRTTAGTGTGTVNATNNWWGSAVLADVAAKISGSVTYKPYYLTSTVGSSGTLSNVTPEITGFTIPNQTGSTVIGTDTINLTMPYSTDTTTRTDLTTLIPTITINTGASVDPLSGATQDFTGSVPYIVTSADGLVSKTYTVTVSKTEPSHVATITSSYAVSSGGTASETITNVPFNTSKATFLAALTKGESHQTWNDTAVSDPVASGDTLVVTAEDGSTRVTYAITTALSSAKAFTAFSFVGYGTGIIDQEAHTIAVSVPYGTNPTALIASFTSSSGSSVAVGVTSQVNNTTPNDFSSPVTYTVTAADSSTQNYVVTVTVAANPAKAITAFSFSGLGTGTIDETTHTIAVNVPYGTNVTNLVATFTTTGDRIIAGQAMPQTSGSTANNFTNPLTYTVIAADNSNQNYVVTVTVALNSAKTIDDFSFSTGPGAINETAHTIAINVPNGTNVTALTPTITISGGSVSPNTGVVQDFTLPFTYTVTAVDSSTQTYIVTVTVLPADQIPADTDVTVNATQKEVVVNSLDETTITVPSNVKDATVNVDSLTTDDGNKTTATLPAINLNVTTSLSTTAVNVEIPASTVVTAPTGWDGTINVPTVKSNSTVTATPDSGNTATVQAVIEVGYGDVKLVFSNAVRILIPGQVGKDVGYSRSGVFTKITNTCSLDTQAVGNALSAEGDCKIDVGSDLVIWTKHFTTFATYTQTTNSNNGGGGGGNYAPPVVTPLIPTGQVLGASIGPIEGCDNRVTGFSVTTGKSCIGNIGKTSIIGQVLGAEKFNFTRFLKKGSKGNEVMELQKFLNDKGHNAGIVDGKFGVKTKAALVKFQIANGLNGDGIIGNLTRAILNK